MSGVTNGHPNVLEAAAEYVARGWKPIPVPLGEKAPRLKGWQHLRLGLTDLPAHFARGDVNIGLLLGDVSGGLVDVDIDSREALAAAPVFLPGTGLVHGRPGRPNSHHWYLVEDAPRTERWQDPDGSTLLELRSSGGQTVAPPSRHPSGEFIVYATSEQGHQNYEVFSIAPPIGLSDGVAPADLKKKPVTHAPGFDGLPAFSPAGDFMMWTSQRGGKLAHEQRPSSQLWIAKVGDLAP